MCGRLDFETDALPQDNTFDRITSPQCQNLWKENSRAALILASIIDLNVARTANRLYIHCDSKYLSGNDHLSLYTLGKWKVAEIPVTPMGVATMDSAYLEEAEVDCAMIVPPGTQAERMMYLATDGHSVESAVERCQDGTEETEGRF
jgi:hypothetical protein